MGRVAALYRPTGQRVLLQRALETRIHIPRFSVVGMGRYFQYMLCSPKARGADSVFSGYDRVCERLLVGDSNESGSVDLLPGCAVRRHRVAGFCAGLHRARRRTKRDRNILGSDRCRHPADCRFRLVSGEAVATLAQGEKKRRDK